MRSNHQRSNNMQPYQLHQPTAVFNHHYHWPSFGNINIHQPALTMFLLRFKGLEDSQLWVRQSTQTFFCCCGMGLNPAECEGASNPLRGAFLRTNATAGIGNLCVAIWGICCRLHWLDMCQAMPLAKLSIGRYQQLDNGGCCTWSASTASKSIGWWCSHAWAQLACWVLLCIPFDILSQCIRSESVVFAMLLSRTAATHWKTFHFCRSQQARRLQLTFAVWYPPLAFECKMM